MTLGVIVCILFHVSAKIIDENEITLQSKYVWIYDDGICLYSPRFERSVTHCNVDVTWFPFDDQKCELNFSPWRVVDYNMLNITVGNLSDFIKYFESQEWNLTRACYHYMYQSTHIVITSSQSNSRRARRKGPIGSDDSQVQGRPSPGKPL